MAGLLIKVGAGLTFVVIAALFIKYVIIPTLFAKEKNQENNEKK